MPNPKRRHSKARRDRRRTHQKLKNPTVSVCSTTGEPHLLHHAYEYDGKLYYKGKVISEKV